MATTVPTRPKATARSDQEARPDAIDRLLADRIRQGLSARIVDPVVVAKVATVLKNGSTNGAVRLVSRASTAPIGPRSVLARVTSDEKRHLAKKLDLRRLAAD
jgi:hypothetical protein